MALTNLNHLILIGVFGASIGCLLKGAIRYLPLKDAWQMDKTAIQYFIYLSGVLSALFAVRLGFGYQLIFTLLLIGALILLALIDLHALTLPDEITLALLWMGLGANSFNMFTSSSTAILGAIFGYGTFWGILWLTQKMRGVPGLGGGDVKLLAALGAWFGWQLVPHLIFIACLSGSIIGLIWLHFTKQNFSKPIPFGPFLAMSGLIVLWWKAQMLDFTHSLMGS